ncbi:hypothetical protein Poli38472_005433 [Pythium oligandrum]|uniref:RAP domain-containing protein n=1 Tax=Pythium oligandrum TaxID=41045 RepID=A0A8K1CGI9_PYTOL|nr:hypothetical protein Poli38472_005433 [Pythium oligandrum]|eukprot:TMW62815.1 hypothetical protein Poli38472_005433 [Pythium oligandrum]
MRAWTKLGARRIATSRARFQRHQLAAVYKDNVRAASFASKYPTNAESAVLDASAEDDKDKSHLVCGKCSSPICKTDDLVFFKWRGGIHVSSLTEAPLQSLRTGSHWNSEEHAWKKHKLNCLTCNHPVGSIARVFSSDKILFSAKEVTIKMPVQQSPMISLSGYPSSMLTFSMWTELLLMLESQPNLKSQLQIRRVDNIRDFSVEKKELNTQLLLASDLRSLLKLVDEHLNEMNAVNLMTALHRAGVLKIAEKKSVTQKPTPRFHVKSEAPEDDLLDFDSHVLLNPAAVNAVNEEINHRLWKLVDAIESVMAFSGSVVESAVRLTNLAAAMWRLNIGRPNILRMIARQAMYRMKAETPLLNAHEASLVASAVASLSSKEIRQEPWVFDLLDAAADVVLADEAAFSATDSIWDVVLPLLRSFAMVGHFHEELSRLAFERVNVGMLEEKFDADQSRGRLTQSQRRIYQIHIDNVQAHRGPEYQLQSGKRLERYQSLFAEEQRHLKNMVFRPRHLVATALESMKLTPVPLYTFEEGYVVDLALPRQRIAIEINDNSVYLARDSASRMDAGDEASADPDVQRIESFKTLSYVDLKARHLEHHGWIVVQLPEEEFRKLNDADHRAEYLSMLIEIATYSRANELDEDFEDKDDL